MNTKVSIWTSKSTLFNKTLSKSTCPNQHKNINIFLLIWTLIFLLLFGLVFVLSWSSLANGEHFGDLYPRWWIGLRCIDRLRLGLWAICHSQHRKFLCSTATANSTMDFSTRPLEDNMVDNPPSGRPRTQVSSSLLLLRSTHQPTSPNSSYRMAQRKFYAEDRLLDNPEVLKAEHQLRISEEIPTIASLLPCHPSLSKGVQMKWSRSSCIFEARATTSEGILPPAPKWRRLDYVKRQCQTHTREPRLEGGHRPWDAWEEKSLKKQRRKSMCQSSASSGGYSRGPELFRTLEKLKNRSLL